MESIADDLTAARFRKSISRKRLRKVGTVTLGEKVRNKLERREAAVGRRVRRRQQDDRRAAAAIATLSALEGAELRDVVRRADQLAVPGQGPALKRGLPLRDPVDHALYFLYLVMAGSTFELDALRRNPELNKALRIWAQQAQRISRREQRALANTHDRAPGTRKKT